MSDEEDAAFQADMDRLARMYASAGTAVAVVGTVVAQQSLVEIGAGIISTGLFFIAIATIGGFKSGFYSLKRKNPG